MTKEEIFEFHWNLATGGKQCDETTQIHMKWVKNAMQEYADQQTTKLKAKNERLTRDLKAQTSTANQLAEHVKAIQAEVESLQSQLAKAEADKPTFEEYTKWWNEQSGVLNMLGVWRFFNKP